MTPQDASLTDSHNKRVAFAVVGTQKGGTTALRRFLSQHPDVGVPLKGEAH